jgi:hypothetical protein
MTHEKTAAMTLMYKHIMGIISGDTTGAVQLNDVESRIIGGVIDRMNTNEALKTIRDIRVTLTDGSAVSLNINRHAAVFREVARALWSEAFKEKDRMTRTVAAPANGRAT